MLHGEKLGNYFRSSEVDSVKVMGKAMQIFTEIQGIFRRDK